MSFRNPLRSLSADNISPGTLSGSIVETGATGRRVVLDPTDLAVLLYSGATTETSPGGLYADVQTTPHPVPLVELDAPSQQADGSGVAWLSLISGGGPSNDQGSFELNTGNGSGGRSSVYAYASDGGANGGEVVLHVFDPTLGTTDLTITSNLLEWTPQTGPGWYADTTGLTLGGALHVAGAVSVDTPVRATGETWHTPTLGTNWATSTTFNGTSGWQPLRYRKDGEDNLIITGTWKAGSTAPTGAVFTLPAGYIPKQQYAQVAAKNASGTVTTGLIAVTTAGNVNVFGGGGLGITAGAEYFINATIPLGNLT